MPNYKSDNINEIFNKTNLWQTYIKVESEMSQAQAEVGIIPQWAADNISKNASIFLEKALLQNQIGRYQYQKKDYSLALKFFKDSYDLSRQLNNRMGIVVNAANIGKTVLAYGVVSSGNEELKKTTALLEKTLEEIAEFNNFANPEYEVYIRNFLGIFYYYLAVRSNLDGSTGYQNAISPQQIIVALKFLEQESNWAKRSLMHFEKALVVARKKIEGDKREPVFVALKQNIGLAKDLVGADKEKVYDLDEMVLPFTLRWQFKYLESLREKGEARLKKLKEADRLLSILPYGASPVDSSTFAMRNMVLAIMSVRNIQ